jgi:signal transduction histidine kinase
MFGPAEGAMGLRNGTVAGAAQRWGRRVRAFPLAAAADAAVAIALAAAALVSLAMAEPSELTGREPDWFAYVLALVLTLPVAVRRRWPLGVFAVVVAGLIAYESRDYAGENVDFFGPVLAFYTAAAQRSRRVSIGAALLLAGGVFAGLLIADPSDGGADGIVTVVLIVAGVWLLGDAARQRRIATERLAAQAEELRAARLNLAEQAVSQERLRIARELHDVVAHHMSVIVIQSALAKDRLDSDADASRHAMEQVESVGRSALREMRQILGVLRQAGEQQGALEPAPGLGDLERLCARAREGGVSVDVAVEGTPSTIAPAVEIAAYRIIQESLTNVVKHAPGSHARVRVRHDPASLLVEVSDDGPGHAGSGGARGDQNGGQGIVGMRERVALLRGAFEAGPLAGGGFRVQASLPLEVAL